ncbi:zinc finger MYM-type protein 1-like [Lolium rigidum]|uniref:zinc finger MYM-type protein 1-like n=1 Tax=Lolium rigidum TaxID=89674 RepID=UPI001F5C24C3|nr:zinc finger MYM-type protein 1-like [Lolium rigidum]
MFDLANVKKDPGMRRAIDEFSTPQIRDKMRWAYLSRGPSRLLGHNFRKTKFGPDWRSFLDAWYTKYDWLEYSVEKDAAYCFYCFLFKSSSNSSQFGHDVFTKSGFRNWKKASENFKSHVGGPSSIHNNARSNCEDFRNKKQSVAYAITSQEEKSHVDYEIRLRAVVGVVRFLIEQGLAFRGHDESSTSRNKGNFRELLDWYGARCKEVADVINENAPGNCQLTSHEIQQDISQACAEETMEVIMSEVENASFSLLVDESRDVSVKEQMAVMVR